MSKRTIFIFVCIGLIVVGIVVTVTSYRVHINPINIPKSDISSISTSLKLYEAELGTFPSTAQGLNPVVGRRYLDKFPKDPWGNPYQYRYPPKHGKYFDIWSFGPDGKDNTEDDITNWPKPDK